MITLTIKQVLAAIRALNLTASYNSETCEFRINLKDGTEDSAYYTDSREDAIGTANAMAKVRDQK